MCYFYHSLITFAALKTQNLVSKLVFSILEWIDDKDRWIDPKMSKLMRLSIIFHLFVHKIFEEANNPIHNVPFPPSLLTLISSVHIFIAVHDFVLHNLFPILLINKSSNYVIFLNVDLIYVCWNKVRKLIHQIFPCAIPHPHRSNISDGCTYLETSLI